MTKDKLQAATELAAILGQENAALRRLDFAEAVALLPAKEAAFVRLAASDTGTSDRQLASPTSDSIAAAGQRLAALATENRTLLEHAITVQTRVIGIIASAIRQQTAPSYSADGRRCPVTRTGAVALSAQA